MNGSVAGYLALTDDQVRVLQAVADDAGDVRRDRARAVLWRWRGRTFREIADLLSVSSGTVRNWVGRFRAGGVDGLYRTAHPGKPRQIADQVRARILAISRTSPPASTGLSHWSSRELARYLARAEGIGVSHVFVADLWREHGLRPHRHGTFKLSRDPRFAEKVADVVALYLHPPAGAVVLSVDEKSQVPALDRTQPLLPMTFDKTEKRTHDYRRHGTTTLFGALNVATGHVTGRCLDRHTATDFLSFLDDVVAEYPNQELHVILDNFSTHSTDDVRRWLSAHPRVTFHFTPVGASWLNQIEIWFGIITRQAIRRGTFSSLKALIRTITDYITTWNHDCKPFTWRATADDILARVRLVESEVRKLHTIS